MADYDDTTEELLGQEVEDMAAYMGVDLRAEPFLLSIVTESMNAPLPGDWDEFEDEAKAP